MKLKYTLTMTLFCSLPVVIAQQRTVSGIVLDKTTNEPIPYASVYLTSMKNGIYSFENGNFSLNYDTPDDTIVISAIGYVTFKDRAANLKTNGNTVYLEQNVFALDEVVVTPDSKATKRMLGKFDRTDGYMCSSVRRLDTLLSFGDEYMHFIDGTAKPVKINRVFVKCRKKNKRLEAIFMLRFYAKEKGSSIPGKLINKEPIVRRVTKTTSGALVFDIDNEGINLPPEGLFISFEHIGYKGHVKISDIYKENETSELSYCCAINKDDNYFLYRIYHNGEYIYYMFLDENGFKGTPFSDGNGNEKRKWKMSVKLEVTEMR